MIHKTHGDSAWKRCNFRVARCEHGGHGLLIALSVDVVTPVARNRDASCHLVLVQKKVIEQRVIVHFWLVDGAAKQVRTLLFSDKRDGVALDIVKLTRSPIEELTLELDGSRLTCGDVLVYLQRTPCISRSLDDFVIASSAVPSVPHLIDGVAVNRPLKSVKTQI